MAGGQVITCNSQQLLDFLPNLILFEVILIKKGPVDQMCCFSTVVHADWLLEGKRKLHQH